MNYRIWGLSWAALAAAACLQAGEIRGSVLDSRGAAVSRAWVQLASPHGAVERTARAGDDGVFRLEDVPPGAYELAVWAPGFQKSHRLVRLVSESPAIELQVALTLEGPSETVTVTPAPGAVERILETPQPVNSIPAETAGERRVLVLPQLLAEQTGLHAQQTAAHQGSLSVRGLTGQQVVTLIDGVRFNNATFRSGPNQYQALIDASALERVEVARGPGSVPYGSDALGGTLNLLTRRPPAPETRRAAGRLSGWLGTVDHSAGGELTASLAGPRLGLAASGFGRQVGELRTGRGLDSHAAVTRFLGLSSRLLGDRLAGAGFDHFGGSARLGARLGGAQHLSFYYTRSQQRGGSRYDQLNGGNGNLRAGFDPQVLDFLYGRYERQGAGWLNSLSATASFNRLRDDRQTQGGDPASPITFDFARTDSTGAQVQATSLIGLRQLLGFGAELFDERVRARLQRLSPGAEVAGQLQRPRFPNGAKYRTYSTYLQDSAYLLSNRWRLTGGLRLSAFRYRTRSRDNPADTVPDAAYQTGDLTYQAASSFFPFAGLSLNAMVSRGFRAPNIADLGQIGLTSNGFEVSTEEAARLGGIIGSTADSTARPAGDRLRSLRPESLLNYEAGLKFQRDRVWAEVSWFVSRLQDFIARRTLLLPSGAIGQTIGGEPIVFQDPLSGWIRVPADARPVLSRANVAEIRLSGLELSQKVRLARPWILEASFFRVRGQDSGRGDAPDIEGGLPPAAGRVRLRYHPGSRWWIEGASILAWRQDRLSSLELADQRIGAARSRSSIAGFFQNGARARGLVANGVLLPTGETLVQVQDRVLGPGVSSAPWFISTPGYVVFHLRAGFDLTERSSLGVVVENLLDKNYRGHGSGIDGPGRGLMARYSLRF